MKTLEARVAAVAAEILAGIEKQTSAQRKLTAAFQSSVHALNAASSSGHNMFGNFGSASARARAAGGG